MLVIYNWILWLLCNYQTKKGISSKIYPQSYSLSSNQYKKILLLFLLYSLFTFFGGDIHNDREMVEGGYQAAAYSDYFNVEYIYILFAQFSFGKLVIWKFYVYGTTILFTIWTLKRLNQVNSWYLLFFILLFLPIMGATRGVLAFSVYLFAAYFILEGKIINKILSIILFISTYFLHASMAIPILLFFVSKIKLNKIFVVSLLISIPFVSGIINEVIMPYLENDAMFMASQMGYKYQQYVYNEDVTFESSFMQRIFNGTTYLYTGLCLALAVCANWKIKLTKYAKRLLSVCFFLSYLAGVISLCDFQNNDVIARRFFTMVMYLLYMIIPELIHTHYLSWKQVKYLLVFGLFRVNWFFAMMLWNEVS